MRLSCLALIVSFAYCNQSDANPIAPPPLEKISEHCVVAVDESRGYVSCAVRYRSPGVFDSVVIKVPFFVDPKYDVARDSIEYGKAHDLLKEATAFRLEVEGVVYTPKWLALEPVEEKDRLDKRPMWICRFYVPWPGDLREFDVVVNYRQELIEGRFLYLPLFEEGAKRRNPEDFKFTGISISRGNFLLETKHEMILGGFGTQTSLVPEHRRLIAIRPIIEQVGAGQPATRPESKSKGDEKPQPEAEGRSR